MKDIIPAKKQSPILGLTGMGGGVGSNIVAGLAEEPKYIDEVFSNYLYNGTAGSQSIPTGLNMAKGGMTWIKARSQNFEHALFDTERGNNTLQSNSDIAQVAYADGLTSFNNDGFTLGADTSRGTVNQDTWDYFSWNFRERKGFFDIVTWTGNGSDPRQISHDLGCVPGFVMIKCTSDVHGWACYHRDWTGKLLELNTTFAGNSSIWKNTTATDTYITVDNQNEVNGNGKTYVGYFFAGGASTAANAKSVEFDGSGDYLSLGSSSDFNFGTGDFTIEAWCYREGSGNFFTMFDHLMGSDEFIIFSYGNDDIRVYAGSGYGHLQSNVNPGNNRWFHCAVVRESGTLKFYINGIQAVTTHSFTKNIPQAGIQIGRSGSGGYCIGKVSNLRVVKGTAVYTTSFKPSTVPLTNITNTKLLCCNQATTTGSTVTPGTITASGDPTASAANPFNDPECYKFGENEDQNLIACGTYGGHNTIFSEINVGWEPSWIMIKRTDSYDNWVVWDSMRGLVTGGDDNAIYLDLTQAEGVSPYIDLTSTGFKLTRQSGMVNNSGSTYSYVAIRRPDGLVGKPADAGTDVFTMDVGTSGSGNPGFDSGFPVDFALMKQPAAGGNWFASARLMQGRYIQPNNGNSGGSDSSGTLFDYSDGYYLSGSLSDWNAWMWKRGAGFDVVNWTGNGTLGNTIPHNMGIAPEMIWVKNRDISQNWYVGHIGLNGGVSPWHKYMDLNLTSFGGDYTVWNDTPPNATHFQVGHESGYNGSGNKMIAFLFASVTGISKVGYYSGNGSTNLTITTGFQPRFLLIKRSDGNGAWHLFDSLRGMGATDKLLQLNSNAAQLDVSYVIPSSTGWTTEGTSLTNGQYIYYAHA